MVSAVYAKEDINILSYKGWNSSWDRCVTEEYVLKDTEENRQLQRDLAQKAQLQLYVFLKPAQCHMELV